MSTQTSTPVVPEFTRGDRLQKAREVTGLTTREFAAEIGVSQKTVVDAENDRRHAVRRILLNAWALRTGVPAEWLETGHVPTRPDSGKPAVLTFAQRSRAA